MCCARKPASLPSPEPVSSDSRTRCGPAPCFQNDSRSTPCPVFRPDPIKTRPCPADANPNLRRHLTLCPARANCERHALFRCRKRTWRGKAFPTLLRRAPVLIGRCAAQNDDCKRCSRQLGSLAKGRITPEVRPAKPTAAFPPAHVFGWRAGNEGLGVSRDRAHKHTRHQRRPLARL